MGFGFCCECEVNEARMAVQGGGVGLGVGAGSYIALCLPVGLKVSRRAVGSRDGRWEKDLGHRLALLSSWPVDGESGWLELKN